MLQVTEEHGKLLTVKDGYLICPTCQQNRRLQRINPETTAHNLQVYCRSCKTEHIIDIQKGQCYLSRSR